MTAPPIAILLELTHRCPLACPYCSNPLSLTPTRDELSTEQWRDVASQAAALGILQVHLSGGEPTLRPDLADLVEHCRNIGLYSNLITSGIGVTRQRLADLQSHGLDHVQLSFQDIDTERANHLSGNRQSHQRKLQFAIWARELDIPITLNFVVHRHNIPRIPDMLEFAHALGVRRVEIAHVQYHGWALSNRAALMPTYEQVLEANEHTAQARLKYAGQLTIDYVSPDYYSRFPKACMGGWGSRFINVTPEGMVLPCHAAQTIATMSFENIKVSALADIWENSESFKRYRGTAWMPEACNSCPRKELDWGGCRCQALTMAGDPGAMDPACANSPLHVGLRALAEQESRAAAPAFHFRQLPGR